MKRIFCLLLAVCIFLSLAVTAFADSYVEMKNPDEIVIRDGGGRPEETQWMYRRWNGLIQARLWSITYGYWLTDWITIGYYDP